MGLGLELRSSHLQKQATYQLSFQPSPTICLNKQTNKQMARDSLAQRRGTLVALEADGTWFPVPMKIAHDYLSLGL